MKVLRFASVADTEAKEAILYYESCEPGLGGKFLNEMESAIQRIRFMPEAWGKLSPRTRHCLLRRFPYALVYQIRAAEIVVVALQDLRRVPARWKKHT